MTDLHRPEGLGPTRRHLLLDFGAVIAAPAIVRASSLMPVRSWVEPMPHGVALDSNRLYATLETLLVPLALGCIIADVIDWVRHRG